MSEEARIRILRAEYGHKLLAAEAEEEALRAELLETQILRDAFQRELRVVTATLQRCYDASRILNEALSRRES